MQTRLQSLRRLSEVLHHIEQNVNDLFNLPLPSLLNDFTNKFVEKRVEVTLKSLTKITPDSDPFLIPSISTTSTLSSGNLESEANDFKERSAEWEHFNDRSECIYYKLQISLTYYGEEQVVNLIVSIPTEYPLKTPQFLLLTRKTNSSSSSSSSSGGSSGSTAGAGVTQNYNSITTYRTIEQEVNVGCLLLFDSLKLEVIENESILEEILDSVFAFQLKVLYSLLASGATFGLVSNNSIGSFVGKNRRSSLLNQLYGKRFVGIC